MTETTLIHFDAARAALTKATQVDEVKAIRDKAEACRIYARQVGASLEMQNQCAEIKIRAERKAGTLLASMDRAPNHRPGPEVSQRATLPELGISRSQSSRWQAEASVPEERLEEIVRVA